jgi:hypothetical protein
MQCLHMPERGQISVVTVGWRPRAPARCRRRMCITSGQKVSIWVKAR